MTAEQLLRTLQLNDTLFPTGGFAYSDGLETAVANDLVKDAESLEQWLRHYIASTFTRCDGLAVRLAMEAHSLNDWNALHILDDELTAMKPAASIRSSSAALGRRFLKSVTAVHRHPDLERLETELHNFPVIYAVIFSTLEIDKTSTLLGFAYARLAGMISVALRVMSIGQQQGQAALTSAIRLVPSAVERIIQCGDAQLTSFAPILDIQQMKHQHLYSRLFRS